MTGTGELGERIKQARLAANVRQDDLEQRCGLTSSSLSKIESGQRAVKAEELAAIAAALGVSPIGLLEPDSFVGSLALAARSSDGLVAAGSVRSELVKIGELHQVLAEDGIAAAPAIAGAPRRTGRDWLRACNELAAWARDRLGGFTPTLSGLADAIELAFGVDVMVADCGGVLVGASIVSDEFPFIFVDARQHPRRALFTLGHELGHVLAGGTPGIHEDPDLSASRGELERDANAFAAALLMPETELRATLDEYGLNADGIAELLRLFGVSYQSLVYRLHNLKIINAAGRDKYLRLGWGALVRSVTDADLRDFLTRDVGHLADRRPPGLLLGRAWQGYLEGSISVRPYARLLGVDADEFAAQLEQPEADYSVPAEDQYAETDDVRYADDPF